MTQNLAASSISTYYPDPEQLQTTESRKEEISHIILRYDFFVRQGIIKKAELTSTFIDKNPLESGSIFWAEIKRIIGPAPEYEQQELVRYTQKLIESCNIELPTKDSKELVYNQASDISERAFLAAEILKVNRRVLQAEVDLEKEQRKHDFEVLNLANLTKDRIQEVIEWTGMQDKVSFTAEEIWMDKERRDNFIEFMIRQRRLIVLDKKRLPQEKALLSNKKKIEMLIQLYRAEQMRKNPQAEPLTDREILEEYGFDQILKAA